MAFRFPAMMMMMPQGPPQDEDYEELWLGCSGPLASIVHSGDKVIYFPQGHMEQVSASTSQAAEQAMPQYDLPPQFLCRVVGVQLRAELDTDEVLAQLCLIPESEDSISMSDSENVVSPRKRPPVNMFSKTLTASDTSTHGGFSIHRKAAEECLPPLDMTMNPPAQELIAKDLHGQEWHFRHIYRGHPKRHLLTTGWSVFVSQKRLVAGDVVIFLRGENGELRVGIRRAAYPVANQPSSVLSSQSMHMGVIATAWHAFATRTMFSVIYKPRVSPAEFIVPVEKYNKAIKSNLAIGMRFTVKLESENAQGRRCCGTITGIGDLEPLRWRGSHWRSIMVSWDDQTATHGLHNRVSPWEIDLCTNPSTPAASNKPLGGMRNKRFRGNVHHCTTTTASVSDLSMLMTTESVLSSKRLVGEEVEKPQMRSTKCEDTQGDGWMVSLDPFHHQYYDLSVKHFLEERGGNHTTSRAALQSPLPKPRNLDESEIKLWEASGLEMHLPSCSPSLAENNGSCKLFGISLTNATSRPSASAMQSDLADEEPLVSHVEESNGQALKPSNKPDETSNDGHFQKQMTARSCTKVMKKGCMLGRALDLSKLDGYDTLFEELEKMFQMEGELKEAQNGWQVAYCDNEGDMLLVGDDPWQEFCDFARKIIILSSEEAQGAGLLQTKPVQPLSGEEAMAAYEDVLR